MQKHESEVRSMECHEGDGAGKVAWGQITADVQS